jgi:hypothetical protein
LAKLGGVLFVAGEMAVQYADERAHFWDEFTFGDVLRGYAPTDRARRLVAAHERALGCDELADILP